LVFSGGDGNLKRYVNKKNNKVYFVLFEDVLEATNGQEDIKKIVYVSTSGQLFCREKNEFMEKFQRRDF
jgi:hypothetical protein